MFVKNVFKKEGRESPFLPSGGPINKKQKHDACCVIVGALRDTGSLGHRC